MSDMTPDQIAADVAQRFPEHIAAHRSAARTAAREGVGPILAADTEDPSPPAGQAVSAPGLDIATDISHLDVTDLGSFGDRRITGVLVEIWGHTRGGQASPAAGVAVPEVEAQGWTRAVLGPDWSAHAYVLRNIGGEFTHLFRVLVLLDHDGHPLPAPSDFFFGFFATEIAFGADRVAVRPLLVQPAANTATAEFIAPTTRAESLCWPVEVTGHVSEDIEPAVEALLQMLRPKAAINHYFRPVRLRVSGHAAVIEFERMKTGLHDEQQIPLPTARDLAHGSDFHRTTQPRLPTPPGSVEEWAAQLNTIFRERFATAGMGSVHHNQ